MSIATDRLLLHDGLANGLGPRRPYAAGFAPENRFPVAPRRTEPGRPPFLLLFHRSVNQAGCGQDAMLVQT